MSSPDQPVLIATRGSALALAQANMILAECRAAFASWRFELNIIKTTGDKMQARPATEPIPSVGKGLFTKELETALLGGEADLAVHSLKDLPTDLPDGLTLGAVGRREDVRDVFIYRAEPTGSLGAAGMPPDASGAPERRGLWPNATVRDLPQGATIATSSTRRQAQVLAMRPDLRVIPVRGNVGTRLRKLAENPEYDGLILAAAGLNRLRFSILPDGRLTAVDAAHSANDAATPGPVPPGLLATYFSPDEMLPCVGQGAIGIEVRKGDARAAAICARLNHEATLQCVTAERVFLHAMGGGCLSPIAAYAELARGQIRLRAVSFRDRDVRRGEVSGPPAEAASLGERLAAELKG